MRIGSILRTGILSGVISLGVSGCKKAPFKPMASVPAEVTQKVDSLVKAADKITNNTSYIFYGNDTLEITNGFLQNTPEYMQKLDKKAVKSTPKVKTGEHFENLMIPKRGGGFDIIPTIKSDFTPMYSEQTVVVKSPQIFTRNGKDMYMPVEYYGKLNPELSKK